MVLPKQSREWSRRMCAHLLLWVFQSLHQRRYIQVYGCKWNITLHKKEISNVICSNMDGPRGYYIKWNKSCMHAKSLQMSPTLCNPMGDSLPGSLVNGILQARIVEWVAIPSSRGSSQLRDGTHVLCLLHWRANSLPLAPPGTGGDCLYLGSPHDSPEMALFSSNSTGYANWCQEVF